MVLVPRIERLKLIEFQNKSISLKRQTELLLLNRSTLYYRSVFLSEKDSEIKKRIQEIHTQYIFYGYRRIAITLRREGNQINKKKVKRLMREMGIMAVYPKPKTSIPHPQNKKFPYLLKDKVITKVNEVWSSDITYIRIRGGWIYLTVVMDWYSRYVISWEISITLEDDFCINVLNKALRMGLPEIFNTDQGVQYTGKAFIEILEKHQIKISMDGKGRCLDNILNERLWRSVKYENVYLKEYETVTEAYKDLKEYFEFYNKKRPHQSLNYRTPSDLFFNQNLLP